MINKMFDTRPPYSACRCHCVGIRARFLLQLPKWYVSALTCDLTLAMIADELRELHQREKEKGITPEHDIDAFMTADAVQGKKESLVSEHIIRILGLDVSLPPNCATCGTLVCHPLPPPCSSQLVSAACGFVLSEPLNWAANEPTTNSVCPYQSSRLAVKT